MSDRGHGRNQVSVVPRHTMSRPDVDCVSIKTWLMWGPDGRASGFRGHSEIQHLGYQERGF